MLFKRKGEPEEDKGVEGQVDAVTGGGAEEAQESPEQRQERLLKEKEEQHKAKELERKERERLREIERKEKKRLAKERKKEKQAEKERRAVEKEERRKQRASDREERRKRKEEDRKQRFEEEEEEFLRREEDWDSIVEEVEVEEGIRKKVEKEKEEEIREAGAGKKAYLMWREARKKRKWKLVRNTLIGLAMLIFGLLSIMSQFWALKKEPCCFLNGGFWLLIGFLVIWTWGLHLWNFFRKGVPMTPPKYWEEMGIEGPRDAVKDQEDEDEDDV